MRTHRTGLVRYTDHDGSEHLIVWVDDDCPEEIDEKRAKIILEQREGAGWEYWRNLRRPNGQVLDVLMLKNI